MKLTNKVYIGVGIIAVIVLAVIFLPKLGQHRFVGVLYTDEMVPTMNKVPVWMQTNADIKKLAGDLDTTNASLRQHECLGAEAPPDKVECDMLSQRKNSLNQQLQDLIHTLNVQNKSPQVIAAAITNIKNLREDQSLQITFTDVTDNPYSDNGKNVDIYKDNYGMEYMVDSATNQVVQFAPGSNASVGFKQSPKLSADQFKQKAVSYLTKHIPDFATVQSDFIYSESAKPGNASYAFRWDGKKIPRGEMPPFVQVVLSPGGDVESFNDTRSLY